MYQYDEHDRQLVTERARQFGRQVQRRLNGELSEEKVLPLRLKNGLYLQLQPRYTEEGEIQTREHC